MAGNCNKLDKSAKEYAESCLNETDEKLTEYVQLIRTWLEENPQINGKPSEQGIVPFLRSCKYDLEKTKGKLANYYAMKSDVPDWFANRDPSLDVIQELVKMCVFVPLEDTHEDKTVVILQVAAHDPKIYAIDDVIKVGLMILDLMASENELLQIYGVIAIFDLENVSFGHARQMTPTTVKRIVNAWQNYHCRPKQLEFLNAPIYINVVLNIFKSFMSEKLKQRIRVHPYGVEHASSIVSPSILPLEYGGSKRSIQTLGAQWAEKLLAHQEWFKTDENYKST